MAMQKLFIATALVQLLAAPLAHASLIDTEVTLRYFFAEDEDRPTVDTVTVGAGPEITCPGSSNVCGILLAGTQTIDIGDSSIVWSYTPIEGEPTAVFNDVIPNYFEFILDPNFMIESYSFETNLTDSGNGDAISRVTADNNEIRIDVHGLAIPVDGAGFTVNMSLAVVPAPAALWLFGSGLIGLFGAPGIRNRLSRGA